MYKISMIHIYIYIRLELRERNALITVIMQIFNIRSHCYKSRHVYYTDDATPKISSLSGCKNIHNIHRYFLNNTSILRNGPF